MATEHGSDPTDVHDIEHFHDYLLAHLEELDRPEEHITWDGLHVMSTPMGETKNSNIEQRRRKQGPHTLPNLLENTLVARFKRVGVSQNSQWSSKRWEVIDRSSHPAPQRNVLPAKDDMGDLRKMSSGRKARKLREVLSAPSGGNGHSKEGSMADQSELFEGSSNTKIIQKAAETVRQARKQLRKDKVNGVPRQFAYTQPKFKVVYDTSGQYRRRQNQRLLCWNDQMHVINAEDLCSNLPAGDASNRQDNNRKTAENNKKTIKADISGEYIFPKEGSFIPSEPNLVQEAGVDWIVKPSASRWRPLIKAPGIHRRCRAPFPVTEALHREGTSVTKIKAKTLRQGDVQVAKVWMGPCDPNVPPAHVARNIKVIPRSSLIMPLA